MYVVSQETLVASPVALERRRSGHISAQISHGKQPVPMQNAATKQYSEPCRAARQRQQAV